MCLDVMLSGLVHAWPKLLKFFFFCKRSSANVYLKCCNNVMRLNCQATQAVLDDSTYVRAKLAYIRPPQVNEELYVYKYELSVGVDSPSNLQINEVEIPITDLRAVHENFTIERNGFQLEHLEVPADIDWENDHDIENRYYPEVKALLRTTARASKVHIFDHTIRRATHNSTIQVQESRKDPDARGQPVARVHVDYTVKSGPARLHAALPHEADRLSKTPFAVIQVWRPLHGPVRDTPLAMLDAATVCKQDLLEYSLIFPGRKGYNYAAQYTPEHRWYYAKGISADEAYVFVCYDSRQDRARFTPHTGFIDPTTPADAVPRHSIETRAFVFWENETQQEVALSL